MTLEAWVQPTALSSSGWTSIIMKERTTSGLSYALYGNDGTPNPPESAGYARIGFIDQKVASAPPLPLNTWTHVALTYDGASMQLYVNGVPRASSALTGSITTSTEPLRIGGTTAFASEYFSGLIDEVRVYNRALALPEILLDMVTPIP
jgi:hypothetical protein